MIPQSYPLFAVESDGTAYAVVGWREDRESITYPVLVPLDPAHARGAVPEDGDTVYRYTTEDPRDKPTPGTVVIGERTPWSVMGEAEIRVELIEIASRLDTLGATGPARGIRQILDNPTGVTSGDDLRERMSRLADWIEKIHGTSPIGGRTAAAHIREELAK